ncbi:MAG: class I mannose-6-phosphate isomerase [Actinomycetota bacterium]
MEPIALGPNQVHRFYLGGPAIAELRGIRSEDDHAPEDWVGSATSVFGSEDLGVARLPDGRSVPEALEADPQGFLGPRHAERFGANPALLVKLLDAGERLPVHFHPDREFARRHLDCPFGKTEAWVIVETRIAEPAVYLGFRRDVDARTVDAWVGRQDTAAILDAMHSLLVEEGDAVLVPAGMPHAIGEGVFIVELQEPTDFSVLLEWEGFDIDGSKDGHLGLGFDVALRCLDRSGWSREDLGRLIGARRGGRDVRPGVDALFPAEADPFFRAERIRPGGPVRLPAGFSILVVTGGEGRLETGRGDVFPLRRGDTVLVPFAAGDCRAIGRVDVLRCMPPDPEAPDAPAPTVR